VQRGVRCELVIYEDEGHPVDKLVNRVDVFERAVAFLDEVVWLAADTMPRAAPWPSG
jgi:dipeptidyl aminopeptidase/acylaminoacyl peptidase